MGPPLRSWRKEVKVWRNGIPCCTEMLTQIAEKAPKWTMGGKPRDLEAERLAPGPLNVKPPDKYPRDAVYSFPQGRERPERPSSAPPGPKYKPRITPTTPRYSFGKTPRPHPFAPPPGPGPILSHTEPGGPKYSCAPRRPMNFFEGPDTPSPQYYAPKRPRSARGPRYGPDSAPQRPPGAPPGSWPPPPAHGPGPDYLPPQEPPGPRYSIRPLFPEKPTEDLRHLGPPWTYFGYNDFGHSDCANCKDLPTVYAKSDKKHTTTLRQEAESDKKSDGATNANREPALSPSAIERYNRALQSKPRRPSSAPAGRTPSRPLTRIQADRVQTLQEAATSEST